MNQLKPILRRVYKGNITHIPEHRIKDWGTLQRTLTEYEVEHGSIYYDPVILARMSGLPKKSVETLLQESKKVYNTSNTNTTEVAWPKQDYKHSLDLMGYEFNSDSKSKRVWDEARKALEKGDVPSASKIARDLNLNYVEVNDIYKKIVKQVQHVLTRARIE